MTVKILVGDCRQIMRTMDAESVDCCITSPPYFGLRDYGKDGQIGQEPEPAEFVEALVEVFREVRRVLKHDGTLWLNLGDSYNAAGRKGQGSRATTTKQRSNRASAAGQDHCRPTDAALKPKDLIGIPWRVAFALQADGWYLRQDIIWAKPNPMPEPVVDRCTKSHEYIFLMSKSERYYFDGPAIAEPAECGRLRGSGPMVQPGTGRNDTAQAGDYRERKSATKAQLNPDRKRNGADGTQASFRAIRDMRK